MVRCPPGCSQGQFRGTLVYFCLFQSEVKVQHIIFSTVESQNPVSCSDVVCQHRFLAKHCSECEIRDEWKKKVESKFAELKDLGRNTGAVPLETEESSF